MRIYTYVYFVGNETKTNLYTSSLISLGLVYPLPQPLISNRPRQCRKPAKGRHPVLKRYSGEGTHKMKNFSHPPNSDMRYYPITRGTVSNQDELDPLPHNKEGHCEKKQ